MKGRGREVVSLAFSPEGSTLASGDGWDNTTRVWDVRTGESLHILWEYSGWGDVNAVAFSPDGRQLASGYDSNVHLWDVSTGELLETLVGHLGTISSVAFSPDGSALASGSQDNTLRLWDLGTAQATHALAGHHDTVTSVAFSPDGLRLASGGWDDTIHIWDADTGKRLRIMEGHTGGVVSIAFSPDGLTLASGSWDDTVRLWNPYTGERLRTMEGHAEWVRSVAFSPDGLTLASGSYDGTVLLWELVRSTTWGGTKRVAATDETKKIQKLSPSAMPVAPTETALLPNYPNPFNPETWIPYHLADDAKVTLNVYDAKGVLVRQLDLGYQPAGFYTERGHAAYWDGRNHQGELVANGVYFCTLRAGNLSFTRKILVGK